MASTRESSSAPNLVPVRVKRAMRPSSMSRTPAMMMNQLAKARSPRAVATMEKIPKKRFPRVKADGRMMRTSTP